MEIEEALIDGKLGILQLVAPKLAVERVVCSIEDLKVNGRNIS